MAVVQNTLIGKSRGSVGGATFSSWKGLNVLKSKAVSVANPQTTAQQTQRQKMSLLVALFRLTSSAVNAGFNNLAVAKSAYNAFVSENLVDASYSGSYPSLTLVWSAIKFAIGSMGSTPIDGLSGASAQEFVVATYETTPPLGGANDDIGWIVAYNETQDNWGDNRGTEQRDDASLNAEMPTNLASSDVIHAWIFFVNRTTGEVSDSTYSTYTVA